jgi:regulator of sigma E protease
MISTQQYGVFDAIVLGVDKTIQLIKVSFATVVNLITGQVSVANLSGPVGVAIGAGASTSSGIMPLLEFLVFFSVSIGFFNLLPLPILDGGHLMYYIIELIRKKPVSEKTQELGFRIGALILILLTCLALFNDFTRL